jgi:hypothetical protein
MNAAFASATFVDVEYLSLSGLDYFFCWIALLFSRYIIN